MNRSVQMKLTTKLEVIEMMGTFLPAAALSAALELGLFWRFVDSPQGNRRASHGIKYT